MALKSPQFYIIPAEDWNAADAALIAEVEARNVARRETLAALETVQEIRTLLDRAIGERNAALEAEKIANENTRKSDEALLKTNSALTAANSAIANLNAEVRALNAKLLEAQKPPVVVPPPTTPTPGDVWPDEPAFTLEGLAALTVEKGQDDPSQAQYDAVRNALTWARAKGLAFKAWRGFLNPGEVFSHLHPNVGAYGKFGNLIQFGRERRFSFIADTVDQVVTTLKDPELKVYLEGLETLKARALVFNDADQYPLSDLKTMILRVRAFSKLPIIASLRATADIALYRNLGLIIEIQTFGNLSELKTFLAKPVDIFCFEARQPVTEAQLKAIYDTILASTIKPKAYFLYTDKALDWPGTPAGEVAILKNFIDRWKA